MVHLLCFLVTVLKLKQFIVLMLTRLLELMVINVLLSFTLYGKANYCVLL